MWAIARRARVEGAVRAALSDERNAATPVLDGSWGRVVTVATWIGRGHFLPEPTRARMRVSVALAREGFGFWAPWRRDVWEADGPPIVSPAGVFRAWDLSGELAGAGLEAIRERQAPLVVDVGTGSGPVALVVARRRPDATVIGIDASPRAVGAARRNAVKGGDVRARFVTGDLLEPIPSRLRGSVDLVVSNIPTDPPSVKGSRGDPRRTLVGPGADGLGLAWSLLEQARDVLRPGGRMVLMLRGWQIDSMRARMEAMGFAEVSITPCRVRPHSFWCIEWEGTDW
jgi:SAM-dependent methyltransferase